METMWSVKISKRSPAGGQLLAQQCVQQSVLKRSTGISAWVMMFLHFTKTVTPTIKVNRTWRPENYSSCPFRERERASLRNLNRVLYGWRFFAFLTKEGSLAHWNRVEIIFNDLDVLDSWSDLSDLPYQAGSSLVFCFQKFLEMTRFDGRMRQWCSADDCYRVLRSVADKKGRLIDLRYQQQNNWLERWIIECPTLSDRFTDDDLEFADN